MTAHREWMREVLAFLITAGIIVLLLLLVVVPAHSQPAPSIPDLADYFFGR